MNRSKYPCAIYLATLALAAMSLGVSAPAFSHGGDTTLIHSCVKKVAPDNFSADSKSNADNDNRGGPNIQIVGPDDECKNGWTPLDWSIEGPPGPTDPVLLGRISTLELQIAELQSQVAELANVQFPPELSITDVTLAEGTGCSANSPAYTTNFIFTVALSRPTTSYVFFDYETVSGSAQYGDFVSLSGHAEWPPGQTTDSITVSVACDYYPETDEVFYLQLSGIINASLGKTEGIGTILNDDVPSVKVKPVSDYYQIFDSMQEGGTVEVIVELSSSAPFPVSVDYATLDGTAVTNDDFPAIAGTVTIAAGQTTANLSVSAYDDEIAEGLEYFYVKISNPVNAVLDTSASQTPFWIDDNDVTVSIGEDVTVTEGNTWASPGTPARIEVVLSQSVGGPVRVRLAQGENIIGAEPAGRAYVYLGNWYGDVILGNTSPSYGCTKSYLGACPLVIFDPGETTAYIDLQVVGDTWDEPDEVFSLELFDIRGAAPGDIYGAITILDDDVPAP